ncbi:MAG: glycosyl hydrolase, partial [Terrimicrobiaceae bacterium]
PGWSSSGGSWVKPEQSMKTVTFSELPVEGGSSLNVQLPIPPHKLNFYRDIAVLAFPTPSDEQNPVAADNRVTYSTNAPGIDVSGLGEGEIDGKSIEIAGAPDQQQPYYLQVTFDKPVILSSAMLKVPRSMATGGNMQYSQDGVTFGPGGRFELKPLEVTGYAVAQIGPEPVALKAIRFPFQFSFEKVKFPPISHVKFSNRSTNPHLLEKALSDKPHGEEMLMPRQMLEGMQRQIPEGVAIRSSSIVDISSKMGPDGTLKWEAPPGNWTIVRFGYTTTGIGNQNGPWGGLEGDKLDPEGIQAVWNGMMKPIIERLGPLTGKTLVASLIDSYEVGGQNWTGRMPEEFKKARGYDITPFLPAFTGRTIDSPEVTERFLWDLRRTVADMFAKYYHKAFTDLCHESGLKSMAQPYLGPYETMKCGSEVDIPMAEFWQGLHWTNVKAVSSLANGYGKPVVAAESFTANAEHGSWRDDPYSMKAFGDWMYCLGVNRFVFHSYVHQPWLDVKPGMKLGAHGSNINRANTWFGVSGEWMKYLARCQYMLQIGRTQADVAYFCGQGSPNLHRPGNPPLPRGYAYDSINADLLMNYAKVENGRLVLKSGANYAVLVLTPEDPLMTPELLNKIKELVEEGLTVVGAPPASSPSLEGYPACDEEVKRLSQELWGDIDGKEVTQNTVGKGRVILGQSLEMVLKDLGVPPACQVPPEFEFIHKTLNGMDYFFVSNQKDQTISADVVFRVAGKVPELFHPDSGKIEEGLGFSVQGGAVTVPLTLDPSGSVFVMFRKNDAGGDRVVAPRSRVVQTKEPVLIQGPWKLSFPPNWGAPESVSLDQLISWPDHSEDGVRYFSGTAIYTKDVEIPAGSLGKNHQVLLDLGVVKNLAQVRLNGVDLGVQWKPPFQVDLTPAAKVGINHLQIEVTNLWPNRLIGDEQLPEDIVWAPYPNPEAERTRNRGAGTGLVNGTWPEWLLKGEPSPSGRFTFSNWKHYFKDSPLLPSGLIGPVQVKFYETRTNEKN